LFLTNQATIAPSGAAFGTKPGKSVGTKSKVPEPVHREARPARRRANINQMDVRECETMTHCLDEAVFTESTGMTLIPTRQ
jgi:hypothetical protein